MTTAVDYVHSFPYAIDRISGKSFPGLHIDLSLRQSPQITTSVMAYLDTGAEFSLLDGALIIPTLGLDLMAGRELRLDSTVGFALTARIHRLEVSHPDLGRFTLDAAISTVPIRRNLLGRDFFRHVQIGFREYHHTFSITPAP